MWCGDLVGPPVSVHLLKALLQACEVHGLALGRPLSVAPGPTFPRHPCSHLHLATCHLRS